MCTLRGKVGGRAVPPDSEGAEVELGRRVARAPPPPAAAALPAIRDPNVFCGTLPDGVPGETGRLVCNRGVTKI